jgi:presenilin-like A22 family membrane protease
MKRAYVAVAATVGLFVVVQVGALALVEPFMDAGYQAVEDPSDPTNSLLYVGAVLLATVVMLASIRLGVDRLLQALVVFAATFIAFYVFSVVVPPVLTVADVNVLAAGGAVALAAGLLSHPEWYVIDAAGVVMGAGAAGIFGISFGLAPALLLLLVLALYDALSVYGTEHMLTLASGAMDLRLPVVFIVPLTLSYSFLDAEGPATLDDDGEPGPGAGTDAGDDAAAGEGDGGGSAGGDGSAGEGDGGVSAGDDGSAGEADASTDAEPVDPFERDAFFVGLGDAVIPTVLVASAAFFRPGGAALLDVPAVAVTVPALGAMAGTLAGLVVLLWLVMKGRAHAGLPLLNGGAIAGYLLGGLLVGVALVDAVGLAPYL